MSGGLLDDDLLLHVVDYKKNEVENANDDAVKDDDNDEIKNVDLVDDIDVVDKDKFNGDE